MAVFGRPSKTSVDRAARAKVWIEARTRLGLVSIMLGVIALIDAWTMIIGLLAGAAAIIVGQKGLRQIKEQPGLLGRRLCIAGTIMGAIGIIAVGEHEDFRFWGQ